MKALILKDFYVLWKQMRVLMLILLVVAAANGTFGSVFIVIWAAMLPYTAIAYDEQSKWDQLAAMMPYSTRDLVLGKYALGWLCAGAASALALLLQAAIRLTGLNVPTGDWTSVLLGFCGSLCIMDITLPLIFRLGVEKGRMGMFLLIFLVCGGTGALSSAASGDAPFESAVLMPALALLPLAALVLTAVSIPVSLRLYKARR